MSIIDWIIFVFAFIGYVYIFMGIATIIKLLDGKIINKEWDTPFLAYIIAIVGYLSVLATSWEHYFKIWDWR